MKEFLRWVLVGYCLGQLIHLVALADAQENTYAASYIGICSEHWPCARSLRVFRDLPVKRMGYLNRTFGRRCPCVKRFLALPGRKLVRVHVANGTCFRERGRSCAKGESFFGESIASADRKLRTRSPDILARFRSGLHEARRNLSTADAETDVLVSTCLECPLSDEARRVLLEEAVKVFPAATFVDSVLTQKCLPGLVCEKHGSRAKLSAPCIADTDGEDFLDMDVDRYGGRTEMCRATFLWTYGFNLLDPARPGFVPPMSRTRKPTPYDFTALRYWLLD